MMPFRTRRSACRPKQHGVALLLVLVIVMTVGLSLMFGRGGERGHHFARDQLTDAALAQAKAALIGYAVTYRDTHDDEVFGYLPCPDATGNGTAEAMTGGCSGSAKGKAAVGLLPYMTLNVADLRDRDGICLWYAVSGKFKAAAGKAVPMNWDTRGQFEVKDAGGGVLATPDDVNGGASAVVFAAGLPLEGQNRIVNAGERCLTKPAEISAYLDGSYDFATTATIALVTGPVFNAGGNLVNNDRLRWITPKEIFDTVKKRSDFNASPNGNIDRLISDLTAALTAKSTLPNPLGATTVGSGAAERLVGGLPGSPELKKNDVAKDLESYFENWGDQFRYVKCSSGSACLNGGTCAGVLIFTGERVDGGPRSSAEAAAIGSFLEGDRLEVWHGTSDTVSIDSHYSAATPATDVARCLNPSGGGGGVAK